MIYQIEVTEYSPTRGVLARFEAGAKVTVSTRNGVIFITANEAGLVSLAQHLLTLSQDSVPSGAHFHFDRFTTLENGSEELVITKE
jgi:hypothetical protein